MRKKAISGELMGKLTRISAHGIVLVIATYLGLYLGLYLDKLTGMAPNFTLVFLFVGIALGFKGFIQEVIQERRAKS